MSWQSTTYSELEAQALSILNENNAVTLKHIDLFNNQQEYIESNNEEYPFNFPCLFIDFSEIQWSNKGRNKKVQEGNGKLRLVIGQEFYSDSYYGSQTQAEKLQRFALLNAVYTSFQGFVGTHFKELFRSKTELDNDHSNVIFDVIEFDLYVCDESAIQPVSKLPIPTQLHINPSYYTNAGLLFDRLTQPNARNINTNNPSTTTGPGAAPVLQANLIIYKLPFDFAGYIANPLSNDQYTGDTPSIHIPDAQNLDGEPIDFTISTESEFPQQFRIQGLGAFTVIEWKKWSLELVAGPIANTHEVGYTIRQGTDEVSSTMVFQVQ